MNQKFLKYYMDIAKRTAKLSSAVRLQVGAIAVKDDKIISIGYNGTPSGWDNDCEYKIYKSSEVLSSIKFPHENNQWIYEDEHGPYRLKSKPEVIHAESNCISKLARSPESGNGTTMFITHAPCMECAKLIYQTGIKEVYYANEYRSTDGIEFLKKCGIVISHFSD